MKTADVVQFSLLQVVNKLAIYLFQNLAHKIVIFVSNEKEKKDSQRVFSLYCGVPHLREYLFNVNIHICEILSSREKDKE